jgi:hypothetical protein
VSAMFGLQWPDGLVDRAYDDRLENSEFKSLSAPLHSLTSCYTGILQIFGLKCIYMQLSQEQHHFLAVNVFIRPSMTGRIMVWRSCPSVCPSVHFVSGS